MADDEIKSLAVPNTRISFEIGLKHTSQFALEGIVNLFILWGEDHFSLTTLLLNLYFLDRSGPVDVQIDLEELGIGVVLLLGCRICMPCVLVQLCVIVLITLQVDAGRGSRRPQPQQASVLGG